MKNKNYLLAIAFLLLVGLSAQAQVLARIEQYRAPKYPASAMINMETYNYRIKFKEPVPPTLTDVLIEDIFINFKKIQNNQNLKISGMSADDVQKTVDFYKTTRWQDIAGYRPWTHYNFFKSLNERDRQTIAREIYAYAGKYGLKEPILKRR